MTGDQSPEALRALQIRRAQADDVPGITALWLDMMAHHEQFDARFRLGPEAPDKYRDYLTTMLENVDYLVQVAEQHDGKLVGYLLGMVLDNPAVFVLPRYGFIAELMVRSEYRKLGVGQRLHQRAVKWFRRKGVDVVQLNVSTLNASGQGFWRRLGYRDFLHVLWYDLAQEEGEAHD